MFNADETLLSVNSAGEYHFVRVTAAMRKAHNVISKRLQLLGSMTPFAGADGSVPFIAMVIKAKDGSAVDLAVLNEEATKTVFIHLIIYTIMC